MDNIKNYNNEDQATLGGRISLALTSGSFTDVSNIVAPYATKMFETVPEDFLTILQRLEGEWGELFIRWQLATAFLRGWRASDAGHRLESAELEMMSEIEFLISQNLTNIALTLSSRINDYFSDAVWLFAKTGDPSARLAAHCAGAIAQDEQRASLMLYLEALSEDWLTRTPELPTIYYRLQDLANEINSKEWTVEDVGELKIKLSKVNLEYLIALGGSDPTVFRQRFPDTFHDYDLIYGEQ